MQDNFVIKETIKLIINLILVLAFIYAFAVVGSLAFN
jgi:hypothetical protein